MCMILFGPAGAQTLGVPHPGGGVPAVVGAGHNSSRNAPSYYYPESTLLLDNNTLIAGNVSGAFLKGFRPALTYLKDVTVDSTTGMVYAVAVTTASAMLYSIDSRNNLQLNATAISANAVPLRPGLSISTAHDELFVVHIDNASSQIVSVFNMSTGGVTSNIPTGFSTIMLAGNPSLYIPGNNTLFVDTATFPGAGSGVISVVSMSGNSIARYLHLSFEPAFMAYDPSSQHVFIGGTREIHVMDAMNYSISGSINVSSPGKMEYDSSNGMLYVLNETGLAVVNASTGTVTSFVRNIQGGYVNGYPASLAINSAAGRIYIAEPGTGIVKVVDMHSNRIVANISVGKYISSIACNPDSGEVYVTNSYSNSISIIRPTLSGSAVYPVLVHVSGKSRHGAWYLNGTNSRSGPIERNSYVLFLGNGTYGYTITGASGYLHPDTITIDVSGPSSRADLVFTPYSAIILDSAIAVAGTIAAAGIVYAAVARARINSKARAEGRKALRDILRKMGR